MSWLKHSQEADPSLPENIVYEQWFKLHVMRKGAPECNAQFAALFQNIQIRTSSEAIAETVGSIMNNHTGKGRYLNPHNFNKEIFLEFNLGPQHLLEDLVDEVYAQRPREFLYKQDESGKFSSYTIQIKENKNMNKLFSLIMLYL